MVPGHKGNTGNEKADEEAKTAVRGRLSDKVLPCSFQGTIPTGKAATIQRQTERFKRENTGSFIAAKNVDKLRQIDPSMPSKALEKPVSGLPRQTSMLIQLRSGHIPLHKD